MTWMKGMFCRLKRESRIPLYNLLWKILDVLDSFLREKGKTKQRDLKNIRKPKIRLSDRFDHIRFCVDE